jgi:hypothetical protein
MLVVSLDQLLAESMVYINIDKDYLFFSSIHHNHTVMVQLPMCRAKISKDVMKILSIDPRIRVFEEQVAEYIGTKYPGINVVVSENHIRTSFDKTACTWFDEDTNPVDITKMPHANLLNDEFSCVPILAIHGVDLSNGINIIDFEIIQVQYIHFRAPTLPDLSKPLFI